MSHRALRGARSFDGWVRLPVSEKRILLITGINTERELWSAHKSLATTGRYLTSLRRAESRKADELAALYSIE